MAEAKSTNTRAKTTATKATAAKAADEKATEAKSTEAEEAKAEEVKADEAKTESDTTASLPEGEERAARIAEEKLAGEKAAAAKAPENVGESVADALTEQDTRDLDEDDSYSSKAMIAQIEAPEAPPEKLLYQVRQFDTSGTMSVLDSMAHPPAAAVAAEKVVDAKLANGGVDA